MCLENNTYFVYYSKIIKKIIFVFFIVLTILLTLLLYRCGFFQPPTKVIEYQEEVKLSDGSFIWVDIKRHYVLGGGGALGDAGNFNKLGYVPTIVEISWDTGFPDVGRQSVFFDGGVILLDKIDGAWYVVGGKASFDGAYKGSKAVNCRDIGAFINNGYTCVYILNKNNTKPQYVELIEPFIKSINVNILTLDGLSDWEHNSGELENSRLSWVKKLELNSSIKTKSRRSLNKPYSEY